MNRQVFYTLIDYTQNLGSHEDVTTGIIATIFYYCPRFTREFLNRIDPKLIKKEYLKSDAENYYIETGVTLKKRGYSFKPDIALYTAKDISELSKGDFVILIESKFDALLTQEKGYENYRRIMESKGVNVVTLLFSTKDYPKHPFHKQLKWKDVLGKVEEIYLAKEDYDSEKMILEDLYPILRDYLSPSIDQLMVKDHVSPAKILRDLKKKVDLKSGKFALDCKLDDWEYSETLLKTLHSFGLAVTDLIAHIEFEENKFISCGISEDKHKMIFYAEWEEENEVKKIEFLGQIDFHLSDWASDYLAVQMRIKSFIAAESEKSEKVKAA